MRVVLKSAPEEWTILSRIGESLFPSLETVNSGADIVEYDKLAPENPFHLFAIHQNILVPAAKPRQEDDGLDVRRNANV